MSVLVRRGMLKAPYLRHEERTAADRRVWRKRIRRLLLKLGAMVLIILLLIAVAWVIPVASQGLCALAGIASSSVAVSSIL
jgi:archaellum biogenesis protein FlaJ (TadC family)